MPYRIVAKTASRPVPDQLRIGYELHGDSGLVDTGSVTMTFPNDPLLNPGQRRQVILNIFRQHVRERVQAMRIADTDFAAVQAAIQAGHFVVSESD